MFLQAIHPHNNLIYSQKLHFENQEEFVCLKKK